MFGFVDRQRQKSGTSRGATAVRENYDVTAYRKEASMKLTSTRPKELHRAAPDLVLFGAQT